MNPNLLGFNAVLALLLFLCLQENVYALLKKIKHTRRLYMQEGHVPTNEELAKRVGITKERLEKVLASARSPISIQEHAWADQDVTVQVTKIFSTCSITKLGISIECNSRIL